MRCDSCEGELKEAFPFCPWCAAPQRIKLVAHFRGHPLIETDPVGLRVSRYLTDTHHVRVSIWNDDRALAAISLEEREAARLATFLTMGGERTRARTLADSLRTSAEALRAELETALRR